MACAFLAEVTVVMTRSPSALASGIAALPSPEPPAVNNSVSPGRALPS